MKEIIEYTNELPDNIMGQTRVCEWCDMEKIPNFKDLNDLWKAIAISAFAKDTYTIYINEKYKDDKDLIINHERGHLRYLNHTLEFWQYINHTPNHQIMEHDAPTQYPVYPELAKPALRNAVANLCSDGGMLARLMMEVSSKARTPLALLQNIQNILDNPDGKEEEVEWQN